MPGSSPGADKPAIAIDRARLTVYVSWYQQIPLALRVARSDDGGRTFGAAYELPTWAAPFMQQLAVRPDGSLQLVWTLGGSPGRPGAPQAVAGAPEDASEFVYHATSTDGGKSFGEPRRIARHAGPGHVHISTLAVDGNGALLCVWGQAETLPDPDARPVRQARHRLWAIRSEDGSEWTAPMVVCPDIPPTTHMGLPALATSGETWWIVTYLADDEKTDVVLLRSDDGRRFTHHATLATRGIPVDQISLMGTFLLRFVKDVAPVGDYIGISAVGNRVAASFILPENDDPGSTPTAYVGVLDLD
jgi:hypothetical protein